MEEEERKERKQLNLWTSKVANSSNFEGERGTWPSPNRTAVSKEQNDGRKGNREMFSLLPISAGRMV